MSEERDRFGRSPARSSLRATAGVQAAGGGSVPSNFGHVPSVGWTPPAGAIASGGKRACDCGSASQFAASASTG